MYGVSLERPIPNAHYFRGNTLSGGIVALIGVTPAGTVHLDPLQVGTFIGGDVLMGYPGDAYLNWGSSFGSGGYGIRSNAGTMEYKNSGGGWAPIATAAGAAGGWTDDGAIVRLTTGTDAVAIGGTTSITSRFFSDATTGNIFNDAGADIDFRVESDLNANHLHVDAGQFGGVGGFGFGAAAIADAFVLINRPALTGLANQSIHTLRISGAGGAATIPAGASPTAATLFLSEPNLTAVGTVADAYTLIIEGAPTEGTNNGALLVSAGRVRFVGMPTSAAGLPAGTLWNNSGVVNIAP